VAGAVKLSGAAVTAAGVVLGFAVVSAVSRGMPAGRDAARNGTGRAAAADARRSEPELERTCADQNSRIEDLRKTEEYLVRRIGELAAADAAARFLPPRDLPARYEGPAVRTAVEEAIAGSGIAGRVHDVDCSAYPCMVVGQYASGKQIGKLQRGLVQNPQYGGDIVLAIAMGADPGAPGAALFGAIIVPRAEPRAAEILAAFKRRRGETLERRVAAAPPPTVPEDDR
jgi:hypothetical protein